MAIIFDSIDALLDIARALPPGQAPDAVYDGLPPTEVPPDTYLCIGLSGSIAGQAGDELHSFRSLGGDGKYRVEVEAEIQCMLSTLLGGSPSDQLQQAARRKVFTVFDGFRNTVMADPTLGGVVSWCLVGSKLEYAQTGPEDVEAGAGRRADIYFTVHVYGLETLGG